MFSNIFLDFDMHFRQLQLLIDVQVMVALDVDKIVILGVLRQVFLWVDSIAVDSDVRHLEQFNPRAFDQVNEVNRQ